MLCMLCQWYIYALHAKAMSITNINFSPRSLHLWDVPVHVGLSALAARTDVTGSVLATYIPLLCPLQEVDQSG